LLRAATEDVQQAKARSGVRRPAWFRDYAQLENNAVEISFSGWMERWANRKRNAFSLSAPEFQSFFRSPKPQDATERTQGQAGGDRTGKQGGGQEGEREVL
jgi:hypothetical protein